MHNVCYIEKTKDLIGSIHIENQETKSPRDRTFSSFHPKKLGFWGYYALPCFNSTIFFSFFNSYAIVSHLYEIDFFLHLTIYL